MKSPLSVIVPMGMVYIASLGAKKTEVGETYIDFGFTPTSFIPMFGKNVMQALKKIDHKFNEEKENQGL